MTWLKFIVMHKSSKDVLTTTNVGFLLAKAMQRWNELLERAFRRRGFAEVKPSYGSILIPLFERDGRRMGELAREARLSKQTMTTLIRSMEDKKLVERRTDPNDGRAIRVCLTDHGKKLEAVAHEVLSDLEAGLEELLGERGVTALEKSLQTLQDLEARTRS